MKTSNTKSPEQEASVVNYTKCLKIEMTILLKLRKNSEGSAQKEEKVVIILSFHMWLL